VPNPVRASLLTLAAAAVLSASPLAQALTLVSSTLNGNQIDTAFSTPELAAVDIGFVTPGSVSLEFEVDAEDIMRGSARFNSIVDNLSGEGFALLQVSLDRGALVAGAVESNDGAVDVAAAGVRSVTLQFAPSMTTQAYLGDSLLTGTAVDWSLGFDTLAAGDRFTLTVTAAVPEPGTWGLMILGLAGVIAGVRGRRQTQ